MDASVADHIENSLHHIYISPLEQCNLCCKMCYTTKSSGRLTNDQIMDFVHRYNQEIAVQSITFCGGEVFLLPEFVSLINQLTHEGFFIQIITNGTIDQLAAISHPNLVNLIVSLDGLPAYHDQNRGPHRWQQSVDFLDKAHRLGFHSEVFSIITKENLPQTQQFEAELAQRIGRPVSVTYHPRKPLSYLQIHPLSNHIGETKGFSFISESDRQELSKEKTVFPPPNLGCYQIAVMSDCQVYGCCEGIHPLGEASTDIQELVTVFRTRIQAWFARHPQDTSLGCIESDFVCGLKEKTCPFKA